MPPRTGALWQASIGAWYTELRSSRIDASPITSAPRALLLTERYDEVGIDGDEKLERLLVELLDVSRIAVEREVHRCHGGYAALY